MVLHSPICPPAIRVTAAWLFAIVLAFPSAVIAQAPQTPAPTPAQTSAEASASNSAPADSVTAIASGVVHTSDGFPVPGATLRLVNTDTQKVFVSWTDESGKFEFPALPPGHYTVEASQLGFVAASLNIELGGGPAPPPLQFVLRVGTLAELAAPTPGRPPSGCRPRCGDGRAYGRPARRRKFPERLRNRRTWQRTRQRRARPAASPRLAERCPRRLGDRRIPANGSNR
jgi:Carboxypeptidase regulatory-like domain